MPLPEVAKADEENNILVMTTGLVQTDVIKRRVRPKTYVFQNEKIFQLLKPGSKQIYKKETALLEPG